MRGQRFAYLALLALATAALGSCGGADESDLRLGSADRASGKSSEAVRASRRAFDGAPPVIPHGELGMTCTECHNLEGMAVRDVGFSPPTPHELTAGLSALSYCKQCHISRQTEETWRASSFEGLPQDLRAGRRHSSGAPPVMPHPKFMRENCQACHTGLAAREAIRTTHPERNHCSQCHVQQIETTEFTGG